MIDRDEKIQHLLNLTNAFADQCDDVIYHYTSSDGLRGIVENSELWLTNTAFVNDTTECKALVRELDILKSGSIANKHVINSWNTFKQQPDGNNTYIVSFSKGEEYLLEQLRAYGNFRIGFDAKAMGNKKFNLFNCVYSKDEIIQWIIDKSKLPEWESEILNDDWKEAAAYKLIYAATRKYKNKHFKNEKEVRLIAHSHHTWEIYTNSPLMHEKDPPIYYKNHEKYNFPVPYVKYFLAEKSTQSDQQERSESESSVEMKRRKLNDEQKLQQDLLPITEVLVGPMLHQREAKLACKILLSDKGYNNVKVETKDIPYRGF